MIITGVMIMLFLGLHFYDFWWPEIKDKFIVFPFDYEKNKLYLSKLKYKKVADKYTKIES
jgi:hypothetical protein